MRQYLLPGFLVLSDIITLTLVTFLSLFIRFEGVVFNEYFLQVLFALPFFLISYLLMLGIMHLYTRVWRYAGMGELGAIIFATSVAAVLFFVLTTLAGFHFPRSLYIISYILATCGIGIGRLMLHYVIIRADQETVAVEDQVPVLIVGAGDAGAMIGREILHFHSQNRVIVGFVDDDPQKKYHLIGGFRILGGRENIPAIVKQHGVKEIIIAMPSAKRSIIKETIELCSGLKCQVKTLPGLYQLIDNEVLVQRLHPVSIDDLLARDEVQLDTQGIEKYITGKTVLVSGAGGSIGSEICRQVMRMKPGKLILLGHGENSIYLIHQELIQLYGRERIIPVIASVRDAKQMDVIFGKYRPNVVFHAAAHKHVPMMERQPMAAVLNNIYGTRNIADAAGGYGAERFVMISTDKAVNPTSVMGASKQVAEKIVHVMNDRYATKYITVRFGNVLGSRGSVIPLFRKQLAEGGPLTVTHPDMVRYFMTIPEASQLVLQAGSMGRGGEVFLLDMGEPVKIIDLARNMIRLSGYEPEVDIKIKITGIRPGEKLYEELLTAAEGTVKTTHEKIFTAKLEAVDETFLHKQIDSFEQCQSAEEVIQVLQNIIPTYHPNHTPGKEVRGEKEESEVASGQWPVASSR